MQRQPSGLVGARLHRGAVEQVAAIFGLLPGLSMKDTGTGLAVAVSIDSGLIRVLLPALIRWGASPGGSG